MGKVKWLWEQKNPQRWFHSHSLKKKGRKVIYLFVRTFRWGKAVRNHLVNRQSKDRRACHLLQWVNSLFLQPSVCEMRYLEGLKTLSSAYVYATSSFLSLWDASTSPRTRCWMCSTNQSVAGGEERQPEDSRADIPKAKQHQRSVPLLPRPCWSRWTRWLMIQAGKHTERPAGSLEDQFITLYFVWPSHPQLSWLESSTIHSAQMVWM